MIENIRRDIGVLFEQAPRTRASFELKEELTENSVERYQDLIEGGMPPEEAYENVMRNLGSVQDLFGSLEDQVDTHQEYLQWRKKSASVVTIAVGLYICAAVVLLGVSLLWDGNIAVILALVTCIPPTCMVVYNQRICPVYQRREETLVEDLREFSYDVRRMKTIRNAISSIIWMLCPVLYFVVSFASGAWHVTWLLFLVAACLEGVVTLLFQLRGGVQQ